MVGFVLRRLGQSVLTIAGVMVITFLLFRVIAGDIASDHVQGGLKATEQAKADWRHLHGYDRPVLVNLHQQLLLVDHTSGDSYLRVEDAPGSEATEKLALIPSDENLQVRMGRYVFGLDADTPLADLMPPPPKKKDADAPPPATGEAKQPPPAVMVVKTSSNATFQVDFTPARTCGELIEMINDAEGNRGPDGERLVTAKVSDLDLRPRSILDSQFIDHLVKSATFQARSLKTNEKLTDIIVQRAPKSLALMLPATAIGWVLAMIISSFVAYYRGRLVDKIGVFGSVLGMCVPFLAYMLYGQWLMFKIAPDHAYGLANRGNIYVPIAIMVIAGLGGSVRFYRTVILDETNRDYVRTALAKGVPLTAVLFKHVLKNCMLPILTNLILAIPFLIMGSLLVETYFGIPGLGDLTLTSINGRDEPIMSGLVLLTAVIWTVGVLITDLSYALFDPRIRLR